MDELLRSKLLRHLGARNFDYTETDRQQVEYVYRWLVQTVGSDDWQALTLKLSQLEAGLKPQAGPKRRRLGAIYLHLKQHSLLSSGRYDCGTLQPPLNRSTYDLGWRI